MIPFAGGNSYSFRQLESLLSRKINPIALELPGRGKRIKEPLLTEIGQIVGNIFPHVHSRINIPYAIYGHSMGAVVGYMLSRRIALEGLTPPIHLFISGRGGPSAIQEEKQTYLLTKEQFEAELKKIGGMPIEILENEELMQFLEPILRADFRAVETFKYSSVSPLTTPITVMIGNQEKVSIDHAMLWQKETSAPVDLRVFEGGHFFIFQHMAEIASIINKKLETHS